jgi:hypothetical protein
VSYRDDDKRARRGWRGPRIRYDLIKEALVALTVVALLTVGLSVVFSSPKVDAISFQSWAKAAPGDFVGTTLAELTGTSGIATYGPPYTDNPENAQSIGPFSPQTWFGVNTPVNAPEDFVIAPLTAWAPLAEDLQAAVGQWTSAAADQQAAWGDAALNSDISIDGTTVTLAPKPAESPASDASPAPSPSLAGAQNADTGPIPTMLSAMLAGAQSGALDSQSINGPGRTYSTDYTKSLLYIADGEYSATVGESYNLLGDQWGIMNQIGNWPGQPWLWWFTMWYLVPGPIRAGFDYSDLIVIVFAVTVLALVFFMPFIPGLRNVPRWLRLYRIIWRPYYRQYGSARKPVSK